MVRTWDFLRDIVGCLLLFGVEWFWGSSRIKLGLDTELLSSLFITARREEVRAWHGVLESKDSIRDSYWGGDGVVKIWVWIANNIFAGIV